MHSIVFTVTNDLSYDQRMIRICTSLAGNGYEVLLVGRKMKDSIPLQQQLFRQKRLNCFFSRGKLFYTEYNLRLFFFLFFHKKDIICAIDLDTILPCLFVSKLFKRKRIYDAHELFCEMKEIVTRPVIYKIWKRIERFAVPRFKHGYTVNNVIAAEFKKMYNVNYGVIRSIAMTQPLSIPIKTEKYVLYQGAVNEGRSFETLIPAMKLVNARLLICGDGNFMEEAKRITALNKLEDKVIFKGKLIPADLAELTRNAYIGITIFEKNGDSNYYSLANRFFDYLQAGLPQVCADYPVYREINNQHEIAVMVNDLSAQNLADAINLLLNDQVLYDKLQQHCLAARQVLSWQNEEKNLLAFYSNIIRG